MSNKKEEIIFKLKTMYPDARCELIYHNQYQLLVAVILSAQATDASVNKVLPSLFSKYPDFISLSEANLVELEKLIHSIGLYKNKANNLKNLAIKIVKDFMGIIPQTKSQLLVLPGVGDKTAAVMLVEGFKQPAFPVDTHVQRVSKRLGLVLAGDNPKIIENKLQKIFPSEKWGELHHQFIFHGRRTCHARRPNCSFCLLNNECPYYQNSDK